MAKAEISSLESILQCPLTGETLSHSQDSTLINRHISSNEHDVKEVFINKSKSWLYPVFDGIVMLHNHYAISLNGKDRDGLSFDKERVFRYYNEVNYALKEQKNIYGDSAKWVDFRPVAKEYIEHSLSKTREYTEQSGKYYLDIASGPIGYPQYMSLSDGFDHRVCIDISFNALLQARANYGENGIYICGDITAIPLKRSVMDTTISQHTVYHIPRDLQETAIRELVRVTKAGNKVAIVYCWFYHSWFMNIALGPVQWYRIFRHLAGKIYARMKPERARLYFYAHDPNWFKRFLDIGDVDAFAWRSVNKYFLDMYIHSSLGGKAILRKIQNWETKKPRLMGQLGEYCVIQIIKK